MRLYGYIGLATILIAEVLLFSSNQFVGHWFTPIVWTGYILFVDALLDRIVGRSLLTTDRVEFLIIAIVSIGCWWLFEFYNAPRFWKSDLEIWWHYHNLEPNPYLRRAGYDWAFATIFPAMFLTAEALVRTVFKKLDCFQPIRISRAGLYALIFFGALMAILPLFIISAWFAPLIWLSFIFLLDPINFLRGWPSITGDLRQGSYRRLFGLLAAGGICGLLWEFWNYWALSRWTYTVPYFGNIKLFEMPVLGYFGFLPFAVECWAMYIFLRSLLTKKPMPANHIWVEG